MAYIYQIRRHSTEQCYVGHTVKQVELRWAAHLVLLSAGRHHSRYLQAAWNKEGGLTAFSFELIEQCDDADKLLREQYYIDNLDSRFNTAKVAGSRLGVLYTEEQKLRLSAQRMGHSTTEEAKRKIGEAHKGKQWKLGYKLTDEQRARCSEAQTGLSRPYAALNAAIARESSPANKPGWIPTHRIGMKDTAEVIEKRRLSVIAALAENPTIWITDNAETRRIPAEEPIPYGWYRGRSFSEEHAEAIRVANAVPKTDQTRATMRESRLRFVAENPERHQEIVASIPKAPWYTNGTLSKKIPEGEAVPDGWVHGRTMDAQKLVASRTPGKPRKARNPVLSDPSVIVARLAAGETPDQIAASLGVSRVSVYRVGSKGGWKFRADLPGDDTSNPELFGD